MVNNFDGNVGFEQRHFGPCRAIQMAYKSLETEADLALLPIGEPWGWAVSLAIRTIVEQMREVVMTKQTRAMVVQCTEN